MTEEQGVNETVAESNGEPETGQADTQDKNWAAARETLAQQKAELEQLKSQNQLLQRWAENQTASQKAAQPANPFEGLSSDDILTVGEFQGVFSKALEQEKGALQKELAELKKAQKVMSYRSQYSDYDRVVQNTLKKAETNPALANAIASSSDPHLLAYELGRQDYANQQQEVAKAQRMVENAGKPGSVANATTGGSSLSAIDMINNLSDADFEKRIAAIKRGA